MMSHKNSNHKIQIQIYQCQILHRLKKIKAKENYY